MKNIITATAIILSSTVAASAVTSAEELFAMSEDSAAETIVRETSVGNPVAAEIKFALTSMNAAERMTFFEADDATRMEIIEARRLLKSGDSPAETSAIGSTD